MPMHTINKLPAAERAGLHKLLVKGECVTAFEYLQTHEPATIHFLMEPRKALLQDAERASRKAAVVGSLCLSVVETDGPCKGCGTYAVPPAVWATIYGYPE